MRNDHSIAGTTILQTTLEDSGKTHFIDRDKSGDTVLHTEKSNIYLVTGFVTINKFVFHQHLLVSLE